MATIHLRRQHRLGASRARGLADDIARQLERDYGVTHRWRNSVLQFRRSGISGRLQVAEDALDLRLELGMMMRPFRDRIEAAVATRLDALLDDAGGES